MNFLRVERFNGSTTKLPLLGKPEITNSYQKQSNATANVLRDDWNEILPTIDKINDEFYIEVNGTDEFGGRLITFDNKNATVKVDLGSFEEDALDAKPSTSAELLGTSLTDAEVVNEAISRVNTLSAGTIDQIESGLRVILSNESPADMIRSMQRLSGAFVYYNPDKTIDYIRPEDTGSGTTIGPSYGNVQDKFDVVENKREEYTHIRVLGASEGGSRIRSTAVVDDYDGTGRVKWDRYPDKDITSQQYADSLAQNLVNEYENRPVKKKVETTTFGGDVRVGDRLLVDSERDSISDELWVINATKVLDGVQDVTRVRLSNRLLTEKQEQEKQRRDLEKFNQGFQGDIVTLTAGGYRGSVDSDSNYQFTFRVPDSIRNVLQAEVFVEGLPYRDDSGGNVTESGSDTPSSIVLRLGQDPNNPALIGNVGSGEVQETVDVSRYVSPGINYIQLESDTLGDIRATASLFGYSQITN